MTWIYSKEDGLNLRTCNICKSTQFKSEDGDWAVYLTYARVKQSFDCWINGIEEKCRHTPEEDSE